MTGSGKWLVAVVVLLVVTACASSRHEATGLAQKSGWQWHTIPTSSYDIASATPANQHGDILRVYMEGDGAAYITATRPSSDPTPRDAVALKLALADQYDGPKAYLARPCQFVLPDHGRGCKQDDWTLGRYAQPIVDNVSQAIDKLKSDTGVSQVFLIGYSGGGALAVLVAAQRNDVAGIITIAANLDLAEWTRKNDLTPMTQSLNPVTKAQAVASIPQVHFIGSNDDVVTPDVTRSFKAHLPEGSPVHIIELPRFDHHCCWTDAWYRLMARPDVKAVFGWE